ncbi:MAG: T9SS type A sorting domain-containing protein [Candidatus Azobacteroides sp.]|nr:T9SS type A sorting domain-containing protein [Candidatus Azobacteroides sp.]
MRKLLLVLLMCIAGISVSMAQSIRTGTAGNKKAASVQPARHLSLATRSMKRAEIQTAVLSPLALHRDVKIVSAVSRGDKSNSLVVQEPGPTALYMRPQGYFKVGMTPEWKVYEADLMLGPAYEPAVWRNLSSESDAYRWQYESPDGSGTVLTSTEKNLNVLYPYEWFEIPTLTATEDGNSSDYRWGTYAYRYIMAGGNANINGDGAMVGVGNYDLSYDFITYATDFGYAFGTTYNNSIEGVANYFEKPVHKYILSGLWAAVYPFTCPANTEFTMIIHRVDDAGNLTDTIATSTCLAADVADNIMSFNGFIAIDPETGLKVGYDYLEIEDAILVEIKGFNNIPGAEINFLAQEFDADPTGENNACVLFADGEIGYYDGSTSLIFNLNVTYSFLFADSETFDAPEGGGEKTFNVTSLFSPETWWLGEALPEWLSFDLVFNSNTWEIRYTLTADPLPANISYRETDVKILTLGADMSIHVQQGKNTGLSAVAATDTKVVKNNADFELTYASGYSEVSVYNVTGQKVAGYHLPAGGTFTVPDENYSKGVYLFNFTGAKGVSTVKVMK